MAEYALVDSVTGTLKETSSNVEPNVMTKPPWRWLPVVRNAQPAFNPATQVAVNSGGVVSGNYVFGWIVRAKTQAELDADASAAAVTLESEISRQIFGVLGKALFQIVNQIRVLQSQPQLTAAQFRTWLKNQQ